MPPTDTHLDKFHSVSPLGRRCGEWSLGEGIRGDGILGDGMGTTVTVWSGYPYCTAGSFGSRLWTTADVCIGAKYLTTFTSSQTIKSRGISQTSTTSDHVTRFMDDFPKRGVELLLWGVPVPAGLLALGDFLISAPLAGTIRHPGWCGPLGLITMGIDPRC